ncbi:unnamed protein product [Brassica rapa subsp. narinosa]
MSNKKNNLISPQMYSLAVLENLSLTVRKQGSDRVGNDRHVEEEPQSIQNSLRMVSCKFMLPLFWSSLMVA